MRKIKKILSILLVVCLFATFTLSVFAENEPVPYYVDFGGGEWNVDGITVTATIDGVAAKDALTIGDWAVIKLENIDSSKMQVRVYAEDGFSALLEVNGDGEVSLFRTIEDCFLPYNLSFVVEEKPQEEVKGDINSDGEVNIIDVVLARAHIVGNNILDESGIAKGDINDDGTLDIVDVVIMRSIIVNG